MLNQKQKAFTLIELLVVIAIISILATLAVVALQQARQNARDSKRMADMKQVQTALELFFNENGRYPTQEEWNSGTITSSSSHEVFMYSIPSAPSPADGSCLEASNTYIYIPQNDGSSYTIDFCTGKQVSDLPEGAKQMTPGGIIIGGSGNTGGSGGNGGGGEEDEFTGTSGTFTDTRDGQTYAWVKIGGQIWMAENLKYLPIIHPSGIYSIPGSDNSSYTEPRYFVYNYNGSDVLEAKASFNYQNHGVLYNGTAALISCPSGWKLPSHDDFTDLERSICYILNNTDCENKFPKDTTTNNSRGTNEGSFMAGNYEIWTNGVLRNNSIFGESGLNIIPGGFWNSYYEGERVIGLNDYFRAWSSTEIYGNSLWGRRITYWNSGSERFSAPHNQGNSVRCIKD